MMYASLLVEGICVYALAFFLLKQEGWDPY
jgi:hypothetical protein